jgi:putative phosphoribosyl transferase
MNRGDLEIPDGAKGIVLFAHGSGSSRHSPRNRYVASVLNRGGLATHLIDLLTEEEEHLRFDIPLLTERLCDAAQWIFENAETKSLPLSLFGASTGAAAALCAAAKIGARIRAVVSRGGRADLAGCALAQVVSPTLLVVGQKDVEVLKMNEEAFLKLRCQKRMEIVPNATHLFEESGALEKVADLALHFILSASIKL